jgi:hypothetical protein
MREFINIDEMSTVRADERVVKRKHICGICGDQYEAKYKTFSDFFSAIYNDNSVHLKVRSDGAWKIVNYDICPNCMRELEAHIETMKNRR